MFLLFVVQSVNVSLETLKIPGGKEEGSRYRIL